MLTGTLIPPPDQDFIQGYPGVLGNHYRPDAHLAGTVVVSNAPRDMIVSWLRVDLAKTETLPSKKSWTDFVVYKEPVYVWRAHDGDGGDDVYAPMDQTSFEFKVPIPRYVPQTIHFGEHGTITYRVVATMAAQVRRGFFRKEYVKITVENSCPIHMTKYEFLSTWPIFSSPSDEHTESENFLFIVLVKQHRRAVGETLCFRAIVHNKTPAPREIKDIKIWLLQKTIFTDALEEASKEILLSRETQAIYEELPGSGVGVYDMEIVVPQERALEMVFDTDHIEIEHRAMLELYTDAESLVMEDFPFSITAFSEDESASLMRRIGSEVSLCGLREASPI